MLVGARFRYQFRTDDAVSAWTVVHHDWLTEAGSERIRDHASDNVRSPARSETDHHAHGPGRVSLRAAVRRNRHRRENDNEKCFRVWFSLDVTGYAGRCACPRLVTTWSNSNSSLMHRRVAQSIHLVMALLIGASAQLAGMVGAAENTGFPVKPVRVLVGIPPGSGIDTVTRAVALQLSQKWGRGVVIDNRPGAGGAIAFDIVARSPADGYTLLGASVGLLSTSRLLKKVTFDPVAAFDPIIEMTAQPYIVIAYQGAPFRSIPELVAYAHANPGTVNYASSGTGSASHLGTELFKSMTGVKLTRVSYKGLPPALNDLVAGQVHVLFGTVLSAAPYIRAGRVTAIAVTTRQRLSAYPALPTVAESGVPGFELTTAYGLYAPAGTPDAVTKRINRDVSATLQLAEVRARFAADGADVAPANTPAEFKASFAREAGRWEMVVKSSGVRDELSATP